jgi:membrane-bound ClpP family serine protease
MVFSTLVCLATCVLLLLLYLWWIKSKPESCNRIELIGLEGIAQEAFVREGFVLIRGELWRARSEKGVIQKGDRVIVTRIGDGLSVHIVKKSQEGGL